MNTALHFSTGTDAWTTPDELFKSLNAEFRFTLDAAAEKHNRKVQNYLGPDHPDPDKRDALTIPWSGRVFLNPPYSRPHQANFIRKAVREFEAGRVEQVVMLLPARVDTAVFHDEIWNTERHEPLPGRQVRFLRGRLKFGGATNSAPFPSMVVVLGHWQ